MDQDRWQKVESLFDRAVDLSLEERERFLERECAEDDLLRSEVEGLLQADSSSGDFLEGDIEAFAAPVLNALSETELASENDWVDEDRSKDLAMGQRLAHYRIVEALGRGGMGAVYLAEDSRLERRVALKILPEEMAGQPELLARFQREAKLVARLNHPNIVQIYSVETAELVTDQSEQGEPQTVHFITMELVDGESLADRIGGTGLGRKGMALEPFLELAIPLTDALNTAHQLGVTHRDLKPANIMLNKAGKVKILDFGLAKLTDIRDEEETLAASAELTRTNAVMGTPAYMSPEQAAGLPADHRSDLFALGIVLYEMLVGLRPFTGRSPIEIMSAILKDSPQEVSDIREDVPFGLARIVRRCLEKDPKDRYQSAVEVHRDLKEQQRLVISGEVSGAPRDSSPSLGSFGALRGAPSKPAFRLAGFAVAALTLVLLGLVLWPRLSRSVGGSASEGQKAPGAALDQLSSIVALPAAVNVPDEDYLTDAIPHTLTTRLSGIEGVDVRLPPSSVEFEKLDGDLALLASAYGTGAFVRTTVQPAADQLVFDVQLVSATDDLLWAREFRGPRDNFLAVVQEVALGIADQLRPGAPAPSGLVNQRTQSSEAEKWYERGNYNHRRYLSTSALEDFEISKRAFEKALELDPDFARAAAHIAGLNVFRFESGDRSEEVLEQVEHWAGRAIDLDPNDGMAWAARANALMHRGSYEAGFDVAMRAATRAPDESFAMNSLALTMPSGELRSAQFREMMRRFPLTITTPVNLAIDLQAMGSPEEAYSAIEDALALEPEMLFALVVKAKILTGLGRYDEADRVIDRFDELGTREGFSAVPTELLRWGVAYRRGDEELERRLWSRLLGIKARDGRVPGLEFSEPLHSTYGSEELQQRLAELDPEMARRVWWDWYDELLISPRHQWVRGLPEFAEILRPARIEFEKSLERIDLARSRGEFPAHLETPLRELRARLSVLDPEFSG